MNLFLFGKTQPKKINNAIFERKKKKKKQCRQSCERLRNDHSPNPREIGTVVESAASHSFLNV